MAPGRELLVDPRTGVLRDLRRVPPPADFPPALRWGWAHLADAGRLGPWHSDTWTGGFAWWDGEAALAAAAGEAVERYAGNLVRGPLRRASWCDLRAAGEDAVDPDDLALFADFQYRSPGFPFQPFRRDLPVQWVRGYGLPGGEPVWVPACLVWTTFATGAPTRSEPRVAAVPYAGVAAGPDVQWAEGAALEELLERDAFCLAWARELSLPPVEPPEWMAAMLRSPADTVRVGLHQVPGDRKVPVVAALAEDEGRRALGVACRGNATAAAAKAAAEALQLLVAARVLDDPTSSYMRRVEAGDAPGWGVKPYRPDRDYRSAYHPQWRDATDLLCNLQLHLDPSLRPALDRRLAGQPRPLAALPQGPRGETPAERRDGLLEELHREGLRTVAVDLTTPDVARAGFAVVRVVVPGLYGNAPAAFPYLGGRRLGSPACRTPPDEIPLPPPYA